MNQQDEKIVCAEADEFHKYSLSLSHASGQNIMALVENLRLRLTDFYSESAKSIFLDKIYALLEEELKEHRDKAHGGQASESCGYEQNAERLLFYIRQEISILPVVVHNSTISNQSRTKVFISYSHADEEYLKEMQRHFKPFEKHFEIWSDKKIQAGAKWKEEIKKAMNETKVAILFVSADFFASEFIMSDELPTLLKAANEEGTTILSIVLKPCTFASFPLSEYHTINPPSRPLLGMNELEKEQVYVNVVEQVMKILNQN